MVTEPFILSIDQGTTSSRVFLFDLSGRVIKKLQRAHQSHFPQPGYVEQSADEIWQNVSAMCQQLFSEYGQNIQTIGITNQRETIICWDTHTGEVLHPAIVWQDNRTDSECAALKQQGAEVLIRSKTGLTINPYFSATKISWLLQHNDTVKAALSKGSLAIGTVDSFLMYQLSSGRIFRTDVTNASRTMLFNIHTMSWDQELLKLFQIPESVLPEVMSSDSVFGETDFGVPITGVLGDQQAALVGQNCFQQGDAKMTFGTGGFFLLNIGEQATSAPDGLLTTVAYDIKGKRHYAIEGGIFHAASIINWLQRLGLIQAPQECDALFTEANTESLEIFIPAFTGLGAPYWRNDIFASWHGLTLATSKAELVCSAIQSIALQSFDLLSALDQFKINQLKVDGGVSHSSCLLQLLSDLSRLKILKPKFLETTVLGAMFVAGLGRGLFKSIDSLKNIWAIDLSFQPSQTEQKKLIQHWQATIQKALQ